MIKDYRYEVHFFNNYCDNLIEIKCNDKDLAEYAKDLIEKGWQVRSSIVDNGEDNEDN